MCTVADGRPIASGRCRTALMPSLTIALGAAVFALAAGPPLVAASLPYDAAVDLYSVSFDSPSFSSLGAMPVGNGRTTANVWVEASTGDLVLLLGLADALDENRHHFLRPELGQPAGGGGANLEPGASEAGKQSV